MESCWLLVEDDVDVVVDVEMTAMTDVVVVVLVEEEEEEEMLLTSGCSSFRRNFRFSDGRFLRDSGRGQRLVAPLSTLKLVRRRPEVGVNLLPEVAACFTSCDFKFLVDARSFRTIQ